MPGLSATDWMTLVGMAVTAVAAFVGVREQTKGLKEGQAEVLRQVQAVHRRLNEYGDKLAELRTEQARLDERIKYLRDSQRFKLRASREAILAGQPPMFDDGEEGPT